MRPLREARLPSALPPTSGRDGTVERLLGERVEKPRVRPIPGRGNCAALLAVDTANAETGRGIHPSLPVAVTMAAMQTTLQAIL